MTHIRVTITTSTIPPQPTRSTMEANQQTQLYLQFGFTKLNSLNFKSDIWFTRSVKYFGPASVHISFNDLEMSFSQFFQDIMIMNKITCENYIHLSNILIANNPGQQPLPLQIFTMHCISWRHARFHLWKKLWHFITILYSLFCVCHNLCLVIRYSSLKPIQSFFFYSMISERSSTLFIEGHNILCLHSKKAM